MSKINIHIEDLEIDHSTTKITEGFKVDFEKVHDTITIAFDSANDVLKDMENILLNEELSDTEKLVAMYAYGNMVGKSTMLIRMMRMKGGDK